MLFFFLKVVLFTIRQQWQPFCLKVSKRQYILCPRSLSASPLEVKRGLILFAPAWMWPWLWNFDLECSGSHRSGMAGAPLTWRFREEKQSCQRFTPHTNSGGAAWTFENKMKRPSSRKIWGSVLGRYPNKRIVRPWCVLPRDSVASHYLVILMTNVQPFL